MGHKWASIRGKKAAKDANNSRVYAKFGVEIYVATKSGGPGPHADQKLRFITERTKTYNVPKHITDRAIRKARGSTDEQYSELRYEGFGPNGSMVIVDTLTNNMNRTAADMWAASGKDSENMGISGAISYMFDSADIIGFTDGNTDGILEYLMKKDIDVRDVVEEDGQTIVYIKPEDFHYAQEALEEKGIEEFTITELEMVPRNGVALEGDDLTNFEKMLDVLEDLEDVRKVRHNVDLPG